MDCDFYVGKHFQTLVETTISPTRCGRMDGARGASLLDCPYDDPVNAAKWMTGWQSTRHHSIKRDIGCC